MMALTLGSKLEGDYQEIVGNRPSEAFAPFKVVFDELAYYVTAGMDGMLAQGRGLGMHFLLGFQEAAGLMARIGEKMWSLLGNANLQIIMRLQDGNQTRTYIEKTAGETHVTQSASYTSASDLSDAHVASTQAEVRQVSRVNWLDVRALRPGEAIVLFQNTRIYTKVFYAAVELAGMIRRNKPSMLDGPIAADVHRRAGRITAVRKALAEGKGKAAASAKVVRSPVLEVMMSELQRAFAASGSPDQQPTPVQAALRAVLACPRDRISANQPADGADEDMGADGVENVVMPPAFEATGEIAAEEGVQSNAAPAPGDHAFSDMLRRAARERDAPVAAFTDPGVVAAADHELARNLVAIERACNQTIPLAKRAVRQLLAERDRVLREPAAAKLPPIAPEELARTVRALTAMLDPGPAATFGTRDTTAPSEQAGPGRPAAAAGPA